MKIAAIILARGGSKRIPNKNIKMFCGKPLVQWTIEQCTNTDYIDEIYVSSDNEDILNLTNIDNRCIAHRRKEELCLDCTTSEEVIMEMINEYFYEYDYIVFPQVTSPIRTSYDIHNAIELCINSNSDSVFSAYVTNDLYLWSKDNERITNYFFSSFEKNTRGNYGYGKKDNIYVENGSIYVCKVKECIDRSCFESSFKRVAPDMVRYIMPKWRSYEIDDPEDWDICELLMKKMLNGELQ